MWPDGKLSPAVIGQSAAGSRGCAGSPIPRRRRPASSSSRSGGIGPGHPFSGEKLSPVLAVYRVRDFDAGEGDRARASTPSRAPATPCRCTARARTARSTWGSTLPVARVIVNQAHAIANGGSFSNGLPLSLSMGCGTWGRNNFSDNLNVRHYMNVTRVVAAASRRACPEVDDLLGAYFARWGR